MLSLTFTTACYIIDSAVQLPLLKNFKQMIYNFKLQCDVNGGFSVYLGERPKHERSVRNGR